MGSLYDIGNFRYKHFTFYSCGEDSCVPPDEKNIGGTHDKEMIAFLDAVWPLKAMVMGESAEGDYAFVTYVRQDSDLKMHVENIYTYVRLSEEVAGGDGADSSRVSKWRQAFTPVKSLHQDSAE